MGLDTRSLKGEFRKPSGYQVPDGPVVSLNDLAILIGNEWKSCESNSEKSYFDNDDLMQFKKSLMAESKYRKYYTPIGTVLDSISENFIAGLIDGRNALFRRYVPKVTVEDVNDWPTDLKKTSKKGFLVSIQELKDELQGLRYVHDGNAFMTLGIDQMEVFLEKAGAELLDYSDTDFDPVNSPVDKSKLKNTLNDRLKQKPSLKGNQYKDAM